MKLRPKLDPLDPMRRYDVDMACDFLGVSRATLYKRVKAGEIRTIKDGSRRFVPGTEIARLSTVGGDA